MPTAATTQTFVLPRGGFAQQAAVGIHFDRKQGVCVQGSDTVPLLHHPALHLPRNLAKFNGCADATDTGGLDFGSPCQGIFCGVHASLIADSSLHCSYF